MKLCGNLSRRYIWGTIFCVCLFGRHYGRKRLGRLISNVTCNQSSRASASAATDLPQQKNGFQRDRRRDAMRGGTIPVIGPGNSAGSRSHMRLIRNRLWIANAAHRLA